MIKFISINFSSDDSKMEFVDNNIRKIEADIKMLKMQIKGMSATPSDSNGVD